MSARCVPIEDLERVGALPAGHAERAHFATCDRCQANHAMLRDFAAASEAPPEAGLEWARPRLRAALGALVQADREAAQEAEPAATRTPLVLPLPPRRGFGWRPVQRFVAIAAALAIVTAVILLRPRGDDSLRGSPAPPRGASAPFETLPARETASGVEIAWAPYPGADRYQVVLLDTSLHEIARLTPVHEPRLLLLAGMLPAGVARHALLGWQVVALSGSDRLASTPAATLRTP